MLDMWEAERAFIRWNIFETPHRHWLKTLGPNWVVMRRRYWKYTSRNWGQLGYCLVLQAIGLSASGCYGRERRTVIALIVLMGAKKWLEYGALQINGTGLLVFRKDISDRCELMEYDTCRANNPIIKQYFKGGDVQSLSGGEHTFHCGILFSLIGQ